MFGAHSGFSTWSTCSQPASPLSRVRPRHIRGLRRSSINDGRVYKTSPTCHIRTEDPAQTNTHHSQMCWIFLHSSAFVIYMSKVESNSQISQILYLVLPSAFVITINKNLWSVKNVSLTVFFFFFFFFFFFLKYLYSFCCCCSRLKWRTLSLWPCRSKNEINASIPALNIRGWTAHINGLLSVSMQRITMDKNSLDYLQNVIASNQKTCIFVVVVVVVVCFTIQLEKEENKNLTNIMLEILHQVLYRSYKTLCRCIVKLNLHISTLYKAALLYFIW